MGALFALTEAQAIAYCDEHKLRPSLHGRHCWKCGASLRKVQWAGRAAMLACTGVGCQVRFTGATAYTPLYGTLLSWKQFLLLALCFSHQHRLDQTAAMLRDEVGLEATHRMFGALRDITGWYVCAASKSVTFARGEVDLDAAQTHVARNNPESSVHKAASSYFVSGPPSDARL